MKGEGYEWERYERGGGWLEINQEVGAFEPLDLSQFLSFLGRAGKYIPGFQ
jgi:hypothetical protein